MFFTLFIYTAGHIDINQNGFYLQPQHDAPLSSTVNGLQRTYNTNTIKWKVNNTQIILTSENNNTTKEPTHRNRIYCPRCIWHIAMAGTKSLCDSRKAYLMGRMKNESAVDLLMRKDQPACYIERIRLDEIIDEQHLSSSSSSSPYPAINSQRGTSGKWIQDWDYAKRNAFIDHVRFYTWGLKGTSDFSIETSLRRNATSYKWVDDNAPITEISLDGFCQVAYHLNITRVLIMGDSLSQDFRRSLEAHLGFTHPGKHEIRSLFEQLVYDQFEIPCEQSVSDPNFRGVTTAFLKMNGLRESRTGVIDVTRSGKADIPDFVSDNPNKTVLVFNVGAHMPNLKEYKLAFDMVLRWVDSWWNDNDDINTNDKLYAFFRETIPGHPECKPQGTKLMNMSPNEVGQLPKEEKEGSHKEQFELTKADDTKPYTSHFEYVTSTLRMMQAAQFQQQSSSDNPPSSWKWFDFKHANGTVEAFNEYSRSVFGRRKEQADNLLHVHWLNVYNSTVLRKDGHVGFGDCLHYLQPGPYSNWVHLFYSGLLDLVRL